MKDNIVLMRYLPKQVPNAKIVFADENYLFPTKNWITRSLGRDLGAILSYFPWVKDKFDCNSFSLVAVGIAKLCWEKTESEEAALAFGYCYYTQYKKASVISNPVPIGRHCINVAIINENDEYKLAFFEPQNKLKELTLCEQELLSVSDVVFS